MKKEIDFAKKTLEEGNLVIFPTETVYGLGGNATNIISIKKIYSLKKRPTNNPLICHFKNYEEVKKNFKISKLDNLLIKSFCPGPLTLILEKKKDSIISPLLSNNSNYVGCRIPSHPLANELLQSLKFPIAAPSANIATKISSTHSDHISLELKNNTYVLEGGSSTLGLESTVVQTFKDEIKILRLGSITLEDLKYKYPNNNITIESINSKLSPGNQLKHYSPNHPIRINVKEVKNNESLLNFGYNKLKSKICEYNLSKNSDLNEAGKNFYNYLHLIDMSKSDGIAVAPIPDYGLGKTINDRLIRASSKI
jgi:L-threonylcarbamoyladenylate synthase